MEESQVSTKFFLSLCNKFQGNKRTALWVAFLLCIIVIIRVLTVTQNQDVFTLKAPLRWSLKAKQRPPTLTSYDPNEDAPYHQVNASAFVIFVCPKCDQGLMDRVRGVVFAYLLSVTLGRRFGADFGLPCIGDMFGESKVKWKRDFAAAMSIKGKVGENYWKYGFNTPVDIFSTQKLLTEARKSPILIVSSSPGSLAFNTLASNKFVGDSVMTELGVKSPNDVTYEKAIRTIFWRLFSLTENARERFLKLLTQSGVTTDSNLVCTHVRNKQIRLSKDGQVHVIRQVLHHGSLFKDPKYFVASDEPDVINLMQSKCKGCSFITTPAGCIKHTGHAVRRGDDCTCASVKRAILEMLILSKCDVFLRSPLSSFSLMPYFLRVNSSQFAPYINPWYPDS